MAFHVQPRHRSPCACLAASGTHCSSVAMRPPPRGTRSSASRKTTGRSRRRARCRGLSTSSRPPARTRPLVCLSCGFGSRCGCASGAGLMCGRITPWGRPQITGATSSCDGKSEHSASDAACGRRAAATSAAAASPHSGPPCVGRGGVSQLVRARGAAGAHVRRVRCATCARAHAARAPACSLRPLLVTAARARGKAWMSEPCTRSSSMLCWARLRTCRHKAYSKQ